jgi:hypothetical protein
MGWWRLFPVWGSAFELVDALPLFRGNFKVGAAGGFDDGEIPEGAVKAEFCFAEGLTNEFADKADGGAGFGGAHADGFCPVIEVGDRLGGEDFWGADNGGDRINSGIRTRDPDEYPIIGLHLVAITGHEPRHFVKSSNCVNGAMIFRVCLE